MTTTINETILIDCPEHPGQIHAELAVFPSEHAGIWECPINGISDVHEHDDFETEVGERLSFNPINGVEAEDVPFYVCGTCKVAIDLDVADPREDAAEAEF
jgi:hypothetical protein